MPLVAQRPDPKLYNLRHRGRTLRYQTNAEHDETWLELAPVTRTLFTKTLTLESLGEVGTLACRISTVGERSCGTGGGKICCIWLPALGVCWAKTLWHNANKAYGMYLMFDMISFKRNLQDKFVESHVALLIRPRLYGRAHIAALAGKPEQ